MPRAAERAQPGPRDRAPQGNATGHRGQQQHRQHQRQIIRVAQWRVHARQDVEHHALRLLQRYITLRHQLHQARRVTAAPHCSTHSRAAPIRPKPVHHRAVPSATFAVRSRSRSHSARLAHTAMAPSNASTTPTHGIQPRGCQSSSAPARAITCSATFNRACASATTGHRHRLQQQLHAVMEEAGSQYHRQQRDPLQHQQDRPLPTDAADSGSGGAHRFIHDSNEPSYPSASHVSAGGCDNDAHRSVAAPTVSDATEGAERFFTDDAMTLPQRCPALGRCFGGAASAAAVTHGINTEKDFPMSTSESPAKTIGFILKLIRKHGWIVGIGSLCFSSFSS